MKIRISNNFRALLLSVLLIFILSASHAQMVESQEDVDKINSKVVEFLINQGCLEKGKTKSEYSKRVDVSEILEDKALGFSKTGIYIIKVFTSHTQQYLLVKDVSNFKILDTDSLDKTLYEVASFLNKHTYSNDKVLAYTEAVLELYKVNEHKDPAVLDKK